MTEFLLCFLRKKENKRQSVRKEAELVMHLLYFTRNGSINILRVILLSRLANFRF